MAKTNKMVTGLIAGAAMGAVAGLLFAPKSGKESRQIRSVRRCVLKSRILRHSSNPRLHSHNTRV